MTGGRGPWRERAARAYDFARTFDLVPLLKAPLAWMRANPFLTLAMALMIPVAIGLDYSLSYLNGPPEWRWIYKHLFGFWEVWLPGAALLALGGAAIYRGTRAVRARLATLAARRAAIFTGLILFGFFHHWLGYTVATPSGFSHWGRIILDPETTSYYTVAQQIAEGTFPPLRETLRRYFDLLPHFKKHASTHPPGAVLVCVAVKGFFEGHPRLCAAAGRVFRCAGLDPDRYRSSPAITLVRVTEADRVAATAVGVLLVLAGLLTAPALFALIRAAGGSAPGVEAIAWSAAAFWVAYPALMIFEPEFDQAYPLVTVLCLYAALRGMLGRPALWGAAVGLLLMTGIFFTFTLLFLIPMLGLLAALELARRADSWRPGAILRQAHPARAEGRRLWVLVGTAVVTCLAVDGILKGVWGIRLFDIFQAASRHQREVLLPEVHRQYHVWLFFNVYDFLFFAGTALAFLALAHCVRIERALHRSLAPLVPAWVVFPVTVIILNVSGLTPAETSRIWLFLAPGVVWAGAEELVRRSGERWRLNLGVLLAAQAVFYYLCRAKLEFIGW